MVSRLTWDEVAAVVGRGLGEEVTGGPPLTPGWSSRTTWAARGERSGPIVVKARYGERAHEKTAWCAARLPLLGARGYPVPSIIWHGMVRDPWHVAVQRRLPGHPLTTLDRRLLDGGPTSGRSRPSSIGWVPPGDNEVVSAQEIDQYLEGLDEPKRATLAQLRQSILAVLPDAVQGMSYGLPAFKVRGKTIAGFAAFKNHLSYLPHSGSVFPELKDELAGYTTSSGALRFDIGSPLPAALVEKLIAVRLRQAFPGEH